MRITRMRFLVAMALLGLLFGGLLSLPVFGQNGAGSTTPAAARSADRSRAGIQIYLPMVAGKFPLATTFGVEMQTINDDGGLQQVSAAGAYVVRRNGLLWSAVQPDEAGGYNWGAVADLESELINAAKENLQVILIVDSAPVWAQKFPGSYCGPIAENKFAAFGSFLQAAVTRYSQPPFNVHYWEIYNEPEKPFEYIESGIGCWGDTGASNHLFGGDYYGKMLSVVYPYIKAGNPSAQVLNGGLLLGCPPDHPDDVCQSDESYAFLQGILQTGANAFDGVSFHSYDYAMPSLGVYSNYNWNSAWNTTGPVLLAKADFVRQVLAQNGASGKYLVNTEAALVNKGAVCDSVCEQNKAYYVSQLYAAGVAADLRMNVWYSIRSGWEHTDLLGAGNVPLPAYNAYKFARSELGDAKFFRSIGDYPGVMGYEFSRIGQRIWLLWSIADASDVTITLPGTPSEVWTWDVTNSQYVAGAPSTSLTVGRAPLYLEWNP